jgi:hypothetical protein
MPKGTVPNKTGSQYWNRAVPPEARRNVRRSNRAKRACKARATGWEWPSATTTTTVAKISTRLDRDGLLDLVVLRYLEWDFDDVWCASTRKATGPIAIRIISNRLRRLFITTRATDTLPRCPRKSDWPSRAKGWASRTDGCTGWTRRKRPCADIGRNRIQRAPRRQIPQPTLTK